MVEHINNLVTVIYENWEELKDNFKKECKKLNIPMSSDEGGDFDLIDLDKIVDIDDLENYQKELIKKIFFDLYEYEQHAGEFDEIIYELIENNI